MARKIFKSRPMKIKAAICLLAASFINASCSSGARGVPAVDRNSEASPSQPANANAAKVQLGVFQELAGTDYLMAPVATPRGREDYSMKSEGPRSDFARNYLFVNLTDKSSYLLLPTNDYLILEAKVLPAGGPAKENKDNKAAPQTEPAKTDNRPAKPDTKWLYYRVVKSDTDNDKQLTGSDRWTVALSDISGREYKELIADVETILYETNRADNLILIYRAEGRNQIAEINLSTKQVTITKDLQEIQPK